MSLAKNLVLEIMHAISYRVRDLMQLLCCEIHKLLVRPSASHDPATVSCVLWLIYSSISSFRQLPFDAKALKYLVRNTILTIMQS
jgi:hypothetical protein